jgi:hypothetical protein
MIYEIDFSGREQSGYETFLTGPQQHGQCTYKVTLRNVRITIVAVEN